MSKEENHEYRNKSIINQRGGTIEINNSTDREEFKISHYSGSNATFTNVVNSELAVNNKQVKVNNDSFETVGSTKSTVVAKDRVDRVYENSYNIKGIRSETEIEALKKWENTYKPIARDNAKFLVNRGGSSYPNGTDTTLGGSRGDNPTLNQEVPVVENGFSGYGPTPKRSHDLDEVTDYIPVPDRGNTTPATPTSPDPQDDVNTGSGHQPGVSEFGPDKNAATEGGSWTPSTEHENLSQQIEDIQDELLPLEQEIGNGGSDIEFVKRDKFVTVGGITNTYPSVRIDPKGRTHPQCVAVGENLAYINTDWVPHVEEVDNDSNFPVGTYTLNVGNRYNVLVGSGGVQFKTSGSVEIGATTIKLAAHKINIQSAAGVVISSESLVELQSKNSITIRSNKQVYIEPGLGVKNNLLVGGGSYTEGETYVHHITAPVEIQQTEETGLFGKFRTETDRTLRIGEVRINGRYYPVTALATGDLIETYPHSHHFKNVPLRLMESNKAVRMQAQAENINQDGGHSAAIEEVHEKKLPVEEPPPTKLPDAVKPEFPSF